MSPGTNDLDVKVPYF